MIPIRDAKNRNTLALYFELFVTEVDDVKKMFKQLIAE
jgi:hypothetical protein